MHLAEYEFAYTDSGEVWIKDRYAVSKRKKT